MTAQQPKALELANKLAARKITNWVHATGDTPRSSGFCSDQECVEAATLLRTQHAELEALRKDVERERKSRQSAQVQNEALKAENLKLETMRQERDGLMAEVERMREDAARYRFARDERDALVGICRFQNPDASRFPVGADARWVPVWPELCDQEIDAARGAKG